MPRLRFHASWQLCVLTLIALVELIGLGTWQAQKMSPKTELIQTIEAGLSAEAMVLPVHLDDPSAVLYRRITFDGTASSAAPIKVFGTNLKGKPGYSLYKPVTRQHGRAVLVNFGWVPIDLKTLPSLPVGNISISGVLIDSAFAGSFSPVNKPEANEWFTANVDEMAAFYGLSSKEYYRFRVFADHMGAAGTLPLGGQVRIDIPNDHFEYMLTWYGLAAGLLGVFGAFTLKRRED